MKLAILSFQSAPMYSQVVALANSRGHEAEEFLFPSDLPFQVEAWKKAESLLHAADALVLPTSMVFIGGKPEWRQLVLERVAAGLRVMLGPWEDEVDGQNRWLAPFGLVATGIQLKGTWRTLVVRRSAVTFHDEELLDGVETVLLESPVLVQAREPARVVLTASGRDLPVDPRTDFAVEWPHDSHVVMAAARNDAGGAVLLGPTSVLSDTWRSPLGYDFPGITVNPRLAENIVGFLLKTPLQR